MRIVRLRAQSYHMADYVDLIHLCELISERTNSAAVKIAAHQAKKAVEGCIVAASHFGPAVKHSRGVSVWFPQNPSLYFSNRGKYLAMRCNEQYSGWVRFLDGFHGAI